MGGEMGLVKLFGKTIPVAAAPPPPMETAEPVDDGGGGGAEGIAEDLRDGKEEKKKPEKITPCPRCKSRATKFCYYNNYNVNQPRHFCKNCQRYWTAGGAMRNVPVGAGRRKTKPSAAAAAAASQPTVLRFGSDSSPPHSSSSSAERSHLSENPHRHSSNPFSVALPFYPAFWGWASPAQEKRSREDKLGEEKSKCRLWTPKTLRMDNPDDAAKSSIWAMAGGMMTADAFLHANPAALSRSLNFHESS